MGDKHLFKKKKKDAVETETMAPDIENQNGQVQTDTDSEKAEHEFVYGMEDLMTRIKVIHRRALIMLPGNRTHRLNPSTWVLRRI